MQTKTKDGWEMVRFEASIPIDCVFSEESDDRLIIYVGGLRHYVYPDGTVDTERVTQSQWEDYTPLTSR